MYNHNMKTISITIDERLLGAVDRAAKSSGRTRSDLVRTALQDWLANGARRRLAAADRAGYERHPVARDEFEGLIAAQSLAAGGTGESDW